MAHPFWSGDIQISLVSFGVNLFPAVEPMSGVHFHQISRRTGARVHHQNVAGEEGALGNEDIVKGYEYKKNQYVPIEPADIRELRIPSRRTVEITQFIAASELNPAFYDRPYFVVPAKDAQLQAFAVIRKALAQTGTLALGKIAFSGREHVLALAAPSESRQAGMMAYTLHYAEELRRAEDYFGSIKKVAVPENQLSLALELIKQNSAPFDPGRFHDEYEAALRELVKARLENRPVPREAARRTGKVINLMDALKKSLHAGKAAPAAKAARRPAGKGPRLVRAARSRSSRTRKSA